MNAASILAWLRAPLFPSSAPSLRTPRDLHAVLMLPQGTLAQALGSSSSAGLRTAGSSLASGSGPAQAFSHLPPGLALWLFLAANSHNPHRVLERAHSGWVALRSVRSKVRSLLAVALLASAVSLLACLSAFLSGPLPTWSLVALAVLAGLCVLSLLFAFLTWRYSKAANAWDMAALALACPDVDIPLGLHMWVVGSYLNLPALQEASAKVCAGSSAASALSTVLPSASQALAQGQGLSAALASCVRFSDRSQSVSRWLLAYSWMALPAVSVVFLVNLWTVGV